jgi:hypothetical protein
MQPANRVPIADGEDAANDQVTVGVPGQAGEVVVPEEWAEGSREAVGHCAGTLLRFHDWLLAAGPSLSRYGVQTDTVSPAKSISTFNPAVRSALIPMSGR